MVGEDQALVRGGQTDEGLRAASAIRAELSRVGIVVLSQHLHRRSTRELLEVAGEGGVGYLLKQGVSDGEAFCAGLRQVAPAAPCSTSRWSRRWSRTRRGASSTGHPAPARSAGADRRGPQQPRHRQPPLPLRDGGRQHIANIYEALELAPVPDDHRRVLAVIELMAAG